MRRRTAAVWLLAALVLSACGNGDASESTGTDPNVDPGRDFSFTTSDGLDLEARLWGDGDDYVILAHMRPADMTSWFDFARLLADEGYTALAFNFRGYGESESDDQAEFSVAEDVRAAIDAANAAGAADVFVVGASMGGTGAVVAAASNDIAGVVTLSAPDVFEDVDAVSWADEVEAPMLLIAADEDGSAAEDALAIAAASNQEPEVVVLSGGQHGTNLFAEHHDEVTRLILEFLEAA
jgi:pimeloyl-ACP methyl ester carboxylesterase